MNINEYKVLGVLYILIMITYLSMSYRHRDNPDTKKGYIVFSIGYLAIGLSYLLFSVDRFGVADAK